MLERPQDGWTHIVLGKDRYRASYLTDIPMDCVTSTIIALKYGLPFCVDFDTEGEYFVILCSSYISNEVEVIYYGEKTELRTYPIKLVELAREIYVDVNDNFDDWVLWNFDDEEDEETCTYRNLLREKLNELKSLIG